MPGMIVFPTRFIFHGRLGWMPWILDLGIQHVAPLETRRAFGVSWRVRIEAQMYRSALDVWPISGEVARVRLKAPLSKSGRAARPSWVRIPPSPFFLWLSRTNSEPILSAAASRVNKNARRGRCADRDRARVPTAGGWAKEVPGHAV